MGYVAIANKLVELLEEIPDFENVFNYEPDTLGVYPCATVTAAGHESAFATIGVHGDNNRRFEFLIRLFYRLSDNQSAETILRDLTDQVIAKLESNVVVEGVWHIAQPTSAVFPYRRAGGAGAGSRNHGEFRCPRESLGEMYKPLLAGRYNAGAMATHKYHYHGETDVNLPQHGIFATGNDTTTVYETDEVINHPDFKEVDKSESKRKESQDDK